MTLDPPIVPEVENHAGSVEPAGALRLLALLPSIPLGGMERAALRVIQEMSVRGASVHVLTNRRWGQKVQAEVAAAGLQQSPISHITSLGLPRSLIEWRAALASFLLSERELAEAHRRHRANTLLAPSLHVAWFARRLARRHDTVSIFRIPNPPLRERSRVRAAFDLAIWRAVGASYDHLVCNSHYTAELVSQFSLQPEKVRVVRNFPPSLNRQVRAPAPNLPAGRRRVVFLGQITPQKGVDVLFEAARRLLPGRDDLEFILAGPEAHLSSYKETLEARIEAAGMADRFLLVGVIDDVQGLLRQTDVHVCPSVSPGDSFPNVVLDAKQAALPSIVLPTAGLPETVEHGVNGIVASDQSPEALASALALLLDDADRRRLMGAAAYASLAKFDPGILSKRWIRLFSSAHDIESGGGA